MSEKYQNKIRKEIASNYKKMYSQLLNVIDLKIQSQSFIQRLKVAMKYLFFVRSLIYTIKRSIKNGKNEILFIEKYSC